MSARRAELKRKTGETEIAVKLNLDGTGKARIRTGIPFFDHMLTLFAKHAVVDLDLRCKGDLEVDAHHTVEDCGIALGQAVVTALGDKKGIRRYGFAFASDNENSREADPHPSPLPEGEGTRVGAKKGTLRGEAYVPMDECLARCVVDFSGRPYLVWRGLDTLAYKSLKPAEKAQDMSSSFRFGLAREFFQGFTNEARCNLHLELLYGEEPHHVVEALFKAFAKAVDIARQRDARISGIIPSTKGKL
jgi:imidazoleglycerol-phosphate dehydratase